jgi:ABC-type branched-subunit amino acid transport system substrate-binding protein
MTRLRSVAALMFVAIAVALPPSAVPPYAAAAAEKLTVAMVNPLTGDAATYGVSHRDGLELAFLEIIDSCLNNGTSVLSDA